MRAKPSMRNALTTALMVLALLGTAACGAGPRDVATGTTAPTHQPEALAFAIDSGPVAAGRFAVTRSDTAPAEVSVATGARTMPPAAAAARTGATRVADVDDDPAGIAPFGQAAKTLARVTVSRSAAPAADSIGIQMTLTIGGG